MNLVLLPGMYGTSALFADFAAALTNPLAAHPVDYPNDVVLSYPDLLELVRSSVPASDPYVIVAESFSTPLAIQFAATRPAHLKGVVLSAGFATSPVRGLLRSLTPFLAPLLAYLPVNEFGASLMLVGSTMPASQQTQLRNAIASVRPKVLMNRVQAVVACNVLDDLRRIEAPVLYMQARHDRIVSSVCLDEMRRVKPDMDVVVLDASHMLLQQLPRESAAIVAAFVRRL
jgi:pimeloyl-ACP methyl ester carboxylesterase